MQDPRHLIFDLSRHRRPGRFGFSALPRHWTSAQSRGYAAETRSRLDDSLVADEPLLAQVSSHLLPRLARFLDRTLVLDCRDVTRVLVEDHRLQHAPHDLAASGLRQHVDEVELANDREGAEVVADSREQLFLELIGRLATLLQHDERRYDLAAEFVGAPRHTGLGDRGVSEERGLDLDGADTVVGDLDDLVGASAEPDIAVRIDRRRVAGEVDLLSRHLLPVVARVPLGLGPKARGEARERALDDEDALLARGKLVPVLIDDGRLDPGERHPAGTRLDR